jgi:hypothetical protein
MLKIILEGKKAMQSALIAVVGRVEKASLLTLYIAAQNVRDEMKEEGKPIVYPVQWDSTAQRKKFFATDGFGRGIPTKRTGGGVNAWKAIRTQDGAETSNPLSHIVFISGRRQSRIHRGRWKLFHIAVDFVLSKLPDKLRSNVIATIREQGFEAR